MHVFSPTAFRLALLGHGPFLVTSRAAPVRPGWVLITCAGPFDATTGHYREKLVVDATPTTTGRTSWRRDQRPYELAELLARGYVARNTARPYG